MACDDDDDDDDVITVATGTKKSRLIYCNHLSLIKLNSLRLLVFTSLDAQTLNVTAVWLDF